MKQEPEWLQESGSVFPERSGRFMGVLEKFLILLRPINKKAAIQKELRHKTFIEF